VSVPAAAGGLNGRLSDESIRMWLIDSGLAVDQGGRLALTEAGAEAAAWA
jgi:hypothetical protein